MTSTPDYASPPKQKPLQMAANPLDEIIAMLKNPWHNPVAPLTPAVALVVGLLPFLALFIFALAQRDEPPAPPRGLKRVGLQGPSNLSDQYSKQYSKGSDPSPANKWRVKALFIYPIKSCAPVELEDTDVIRTGLRYDRQFTLAQQVTSLPSLDGSVSSEWTFITQRTFPRLAKVQTQVWIPDPSSPEYSPDNEFVQSDGCLVIRFPFSPDTDFTTQGFRNLGRILAAKIQGASEPMLEFRIPFNPPRHRIKEKKCRSEKLSIWKDHPMALNMGPEISPEMMAKLKYTLGVTNPLTLFRIDPTKYREVFKCAPKKKDVNFQTMIGMQDSYPMHVLNLASVHHVASQLPKRHGPLNALRYRANVYITGPPAFSEDDWKKAQIGHGKYHFSCRTTRCKLPNVDPETAVADRNEPGTTMRKYRVIDQGSQSACLGMQVTPLEGGKITVGDEIKVLETGEHFFLKE